MKERMSSLETLQFAVLATEFFCLSSLSNRTCRPLCSSFGATTQLQLTRTTPSPGIYGTCQQPQNFRKHNTGSTLALYSPPPTGPKSCTGLPVHLTRNFSSDVPTPQHHCMRSLRWQKNPKSACVFFALPLLSSMCTCCQCALE